MESNRLLMNHKIVSFYHKNLNPQIKSLQKKVFDKLELDVNYCEFEGSHGSAIKNFLDNNEWDVITLFDVDCIPLNKNVIKKVLELTNDNTIYGNAQVSNSFPYAAPSFLSFTKKTYEDSTQKSFEGMFYHDGNEQYYEADCAEVFIKENLKRGIKQILSYPLRSIEKKWRYSGNNQYPEFEYGNGTLFDNETFHSFQIRLPETQSIFINFVENFLNEKN